MSAGATWIDAYERLRSLDPSGLTAGQLEALADAAWLLCRLDESTAARQQSCVRYLEAGENGPAARAAWRLFWEHLYGGGAVVAMGWLRRARQHLAAMPETAGHGLVALADAELALNRGELDEAAASAPRAIEVGDRQDSQGIVALGLTIYGRVLIGRGDREEGLASFDEAMTLVLTGQLDDYFAGAVYCALIAECREIADIRRGSEWTDAAGAWCGSLPATTPFHGICRIHRGEILCLRGFWEEAESEIRTAADELATFKPRSAAEAHYALEELNRRRGDISAAEDAFLRAHELGRRLLTDARGTLGARGHRCSIMRPGDMSSADATPPCRALPRGAWPKYAHSVSSGFPLWWRLGLATTEVVLAAGLIVAAVTEGSWYWWAGAIAAATLALINLSVYLRTERERRRPDASM